MFKIALYLCLGRHRRKCRYMQVSSIKVEVPLASMYFSTSTARGCVYVLNTSKKYVLCIVIVLVLIEYIVVNNNI